MVAMKQKKNESEEYVITFVFTEDLSRVWLITKNRPDWQKGKLNGIGGKVESHDINGAIDAAHRELFQETDFDAADLKHVGYMHGINNGDTYFRVDIFATVTDAVLKTCTDEKVNLYKVKQVLHPETTDAYSRCVENVPMLIEASKLMLSATYPPTRIIMEYSEVPEMHDALILNKLAFRSECLEDVEQVQELLEQHDANIKFNIVPDTNGLPDVDVTLVTRLELGEVEIILEDLVDGHIILETLDTLDNYDGERKTKLKFKVGYKADMVYLEELLLDFKIKHSFESEVSLTGANIVTLRSTLSKDEFFNLIKMNEKRIIDVQTILKTVK